MSVGLIPNQLQLEQLQSTKHYNATEYSLANILMMIASQPRENVIQMLQELKLSDDYQGTVTKLVNNLNFIEPVTLNINELLIKPAEFDRLSYRLPYVFDDTSTTNIRVLDQKLGDKSLFQTLTDTNAPKTTKVRYLIFKAVLGQCMGYDHFRNKILDDLIRDNYQEDVNDLAYIEIFLNLPLQQALTTTRSFQQYLINSTGGNRSSSVVDYASLLFLYSIEHGDFLLRCKPLLSRIDCEYIFHKMQQYAPEPIIVDRCIYTVNQVLNCFHEIKSFKITAKPSDDTKTIIEFIPSDTTYDYIDLPHYVNILDYAKNIIKLVYPYGNYEVLRLCLQLSPYNMDDAANIQVSMTRTDNDIDAALVLKCLWNTLIGETCNLAYLFHILVNKREKNTHTRAETDALLKFVLFDKTPLGKLPIDISEVEYAVKTVMKGSTYEDKLYYATFFRVKEPELARYVYTHTDVTDSEFEAIKCLYATSPFTTYAGRKLISLLDHKHLQDPSIGIDNRTFAVPGSDYRRENAAIRTPMRTSNELEYRVYADYYMRTKDRSVLHLL